MTKKMTRTEEHEYYADPENQTPQGPARRRASKLTELVPVRFPPETLDRIRNAAVADDRSISSWIRRAVEHELEAHDAAVAAAARSAPPPSEYARQTFVGAQSRAGPPR